MSVTANFASDLDAETVVRLLSTTRAVRKRLDLDRPVERQVILDCIRLATQAPSGSNSQRWRWLVVTDPARRRALADLYRGVWESTYAQTGPSSTDATGLRIFDSANYLYEHLADVPVHVVPCMLGRLPETNSPAMAAGFYGSIFPAVWSLQLALRSRGLGSVLTTMHLVRETEAAEVLGIPDSVTQVALLPVAYYRGEGFLPAARRAADEITYWDTWRNSDHTL